MTCSDHIFETIQIISTHILTKRMTITFYSFCTIIAIFQLTSSRRGWRDSFALFHCHTDISTHILTKRMTCDQFRIAWLSSVFQLTSSRRGWRHCFAKWWKGKWHFNSHPHEEDDAIVSLCFTAIPIFQLTSSRRGWRAISFGSRGFLAYFNSHPHEEDDDIALLNDEKANGISTHILTKRMTVFPSFPTGNITISTHILTKRMTNIYLVCCWEVWHFNSHPHEEDDNSLFFRKFFIWISTHILTKRMTAFIVFGIVSFTFQLTSSRRGWPLSVKTTALPNNFNSHPHEEDDCVSKFSCWEHNKFQLTSSRRGWQQF